MTCDPLPTANRAALYDRWQDEDTWTVTNDGSRTARETALDASFHEVEDDEQ